MSLFASTCHLHYPWILLHLLCLLLILVLPHSYLCLSAAQRQLVTDAKGALLIAPDKLSNCSDGCDGDRTAGNREAKDSSGLASNSTAILREDLFTISPTIPPVLFSESHVIKNSSLPNSSSSSVLPSPLDFQSSLVGTENESTQPLPPRLSSVPPRVEAGVQSDSTPPSQPPQAIDPSLNHVTLVTSISPQHPTKSEPIASSLVKSTSTHLVLGGDISVDRPPPSKTSSDARSQNTTTAEPQLTDAVTTAGSANRDTITPTDKSSSSPSTTSSQPVGPNDGTPPQNTIATIATKAGTLSLHSPTTRKTHPTIPHHKFVGQGTRSSVVEVAGAALTLQLVDTTSLLAVLLFGLLFFFVTMLIFATQAYESYRRKDYTQVDYLINGMYADSGV